MDYCDSKSGLPTSTKILKVNHAGENGAINIYRAQLFFCNLFMKQHTPLLNDFLEDEKRHLAIFWEEITKRKGVKCKSFILCAIGGYAMGFISCLFGFKGIMACTLAVESVVTNHLKDQLIYLSKINDLDAINCVQSILNDEINHRDIGASLGGATKGVLYQILRFAISAFTEIIIRFGMR